MAADARRSGPVVLVGGAVLVIALAFGAGLGGAFGRPAAPGANLVGATDSGVTAYDCPGGSPIATLRPGDRVLVTARTEDGDYIAVRYAGAQYETVWLPFGSVGDLDTEALPVSGCLVPVVGG